MIKIKNKMAMALNRRGIELEKHPKKDAFPQLLFNRHNPNNCFK